MAHQYIDIHAVAVPIIAINTLAPEQVFLYYQNKRKSTTKCYEYFSRLIKMKSYVFSAILEVDKGEDTIHVYKDGYKIEYNGVRDPETFVSWLMDVSLLLQFVS